MAFAERVRQMAQSPQGARLFEEAAKLAKDPRSRDRIVQAQRALTDEHDVVAGPAPEGAGARPRRRP
jgi:hypothetical protein